MRTEYHPKLNIFVREDGCIFLPQSGVHRAHWTYGSKNGCGYRQVAIAGKRYSVHRLVAEAFFGEIPDGYEVDHINRNRGDNSVENLRIVTPSENQRNTSQNDRVDARGGTHKYEDKKQYQREKDARRKKTHREVLFSNGSRHWIPLPEAEAYLIIPLKERHYGK